MDLLSPSPTTNSPLSTSNTPVFGDNVQDLLNAGTLNVNKSAIITVNSIADAVNSNNGVTTLRDAINQANADNGEDLIVFDRSLFSNGQTIGLNLGELDITHNLDIIAPRDSLTGADLLTVSGNNASRVFEIEPGAAVRIDGLIEADGKVADDGGGIKNSGILTLENSIVHNNVAGNRNYTPDDVSGGNGGGIFNGNDATLTVSNSVISSNSVFSLKNSLGGGIYNIGGTVTVSNSTLSDNHALPNSIGPSSQQTISGGGIYNTGMGIVTVIDSTIKNNGISGAFNKNIGGGISNDDGMVTLSDSTLSGNSVNAVGAIGGGIYNSSSSTLTVSNSTISGNSALSSFSEGDSRGGGIYNDGGNVTVSGSNLSGNLTEGSDVTSGGGIDNVGGIVTVSNSTISGNSSPGIRGSFGGGIDNSGTVTVSNSIISKNTATYGGGIYNSGDANVGNTIIAANVKSTNASAVSSDVSGTFTSEGYNLIGDGTGSTGFDAIGDIVGTSDNPIDPKLP